MLRTLNHVSASQISTYQRCPRKHWLEKIEGVEVPVSAGAAFGSRCHAAVETRIETGAWPDDPEAVPVAMAGWKFVPQDTQLLVEHEMRLTDAALPIVGRIDLIAPERSVIIDHKFLSSLRWAKTMEQLSQDPQAILYCTWGLREGYLESGRVTFRHITYQTKGVPEARTTQVQFLPSVLEARYAQLKTTIERMAEHAAMSDPAKVAGAMESDDPSPCKAYGGCPHLARCKSLLGRSVWSETETKADKEETVNVLEVLAKKKKAQGVVDVGAVNPPDGTGGALAQPLLAGGDPPSAAVADAPSAQVDLFAFPPSDAEMAEFHTEQAKAYADKAKAAPAQGNGNVVSTPVAVTTPTLYVGCLPAGESYVLLEDWLAPLMVEAASIVGVDYYAQAEYGKGKAALGALLIHKLKAEPLPAALVVDPRLPVADVALDVLRPVYQRKILKIG